MIDSTENDVEVQPNIEKEIEQDPPEIQTNTTIEPVVEKEVDSSKEIKQEEPAIQPNTITEPQVLTDARVNNQPPDHIRKEQEHISDFFKKYFKLDT